jgi:8-oxo-dGTP pyrophosphatase MutT (NUDIX family)
MPKLNRFEDLGDIDDLMMDMAGVKEIVAGVAVVWNGHILLVHPTNASWRNSALGIPKGHVEEGEEYIDAAVRELKEETGIEISTNDLNQDMLSVPMYKGKEIEKMLLYFELHINSPSEIGMDSLKINKNKLQLTEIDWAGFVPIRDAYPLMHRNQLIILDRLT